MKNSVEKMIGIVCEWMKLILIWWCDLGFCKYECKDRQLSSSFDKFKCYYMCTFCYIAYTIILSPIRIKLVGFLLVKWHYYCWIEMIFLLTNSHFCALSIEPLFSLQCNLKKNIIHTLNNILIVTTIYIPQQK